MLLQVGQVLNNRYRIVRLLGRGGFGSVYRAWDLNLTRPCAVKENIEISSEAQRQFLREATVLANLSHPNLPRVTDYFAIPDQAQYLVMDFVDGEDLNSALKRQGVIPVSQALGWITQVADALIYLHNLHPPVVHRDVKPANIRVTPDGKAMLVDFGLVKLFNPESRTTLGARAVTPGYAPPEQYGRASTDARTDQYALAATLYHLISGQQPPESVQRMIRDEMPPAHQLNPQVPPNISPVIERAMQLDPEKRFPDVIAFKAGLLASQEPVLVSRAGAPVSAAPAAITPASAARVSTPPGSAPPGSAPPIPATQVMPVFPAPAGAAGHLAPPAVLDESGNLNQRRSSGSKTLRVLGVVALVLLCCVITGLWGGWRLGQWLIDIQGDPAVLKTSTQKAAIPVQFTHTPNARQTQTAQALTQQLATQTAQARTPPTAQPTANPIDTYVQQLESVKSLIFGPEQGYLDHRTDGVIADYEAEVTVANFIVQASFYNPYGTQTGTWDYGFLLRDEAVNQQYRLILLSNSTWKFANRAGDEDSTVLAYGSLPNFDTSEGGKNDVRVYFDHTRGMLFVNGSFIATLDLSARPGAGTISVATGLVNADMVEGASTEYAEFTIWELP